MNLEFTGISEISIAIKALASSLAVGIAYCVIFIYAMSRFPKQMVYASIACMELIFVGIALTSLIQGS